MHTHTRSRAGSFGAADSSRLEQWQKSPAKELVLPLEQVMLTAQLLPTVILPGTCRREMLGSSPSSASAVLVSGIMLNSVRECCAFSKHRE